MTDFCQEKKVSKEMIDGYDYYPLPEKNEIPIYIAMTTIPPRMMTELFERHLLSLWIQTRRVEKIILSLPLRYKRSFDEEFSVQEWAARITYLQERFGSRLWIHEMDTDYGPATKYLGPLLLHQKGLLNLDQRILIIVDDDHYYHSRMADIYDRFFVQHPTISVATGNNTIYFLPAKSIHIDETNIQYTENKRKTVCGFMSFGLRCSNALLEQLLEYTLRILDVYPESFYHDEGILLNFLWGSKLPVYYLQFMFVDILSQEMSNALCLKRDVCRYRKNIEKHIRIMTMYHHLLPYFYSYKTLMGYTSQ